MQIIPLQYETNAKSPKKCITGKKNWTTWKLPLLIYQFVYKWKCAYCTANYSSKILPDTTYDGTSGGASQEGSLHQTCLFAKQNIRHVYSSNYLSSTGSWSHGLVAPEVQIFYYCLWLAIGWYTVASLGISHGH